MKKMLLIPMLCAAGFAFGQANTAAAPSQDLNPQGGPPMLGIHWARGFEPNARITNEAKSARARRSPNMTYHGGKIMPTAVTKAVFWGTSWGSYSGDKISGMDLWYNGFNISNYAKTSDEYTGTNGQVTSSTNHLGHIVDTSASTGGGNTSTILAEVCKAIGTLTVVATATMPSTPIHRAAMPTTALTTATEPAAAFPFSLRTSSSSMATQAAIRRTPQDCTRRVWQPSQMSAATNSLKRAQIPPAQARGTTLPARRTATNAHGPSAPHSSPSPTTPSGRSRANGPMRPTPPAPAIPIAPVNTAASPETDTTRYTTFKGRPIHRTAFFCCAQPVRQQRRRIRNSTSSPHAPVPQRRPLSSCVWWPDPCNARFRRDLFEDRS